MASSLSLDSRESRVYQDLPVPPPPPSKALGYTLIALGSISLVAVAFICFKGLKIPVGTKIPLKKAIFCVTVLVALPAIAGASLACGPLILVKNSQRRRFEEQILVYYASFGKLEKIQDLCSHTRGFSLETLNEAVRFSALYNHDRVVDYLLLESQKRSPEVLQTNLNAALKVAVSFGHVSLTQSLLSKIEDISVECLKKALKDKVCIAAGLGHLELTQFLWSKAEEILLEDQEIILEKTLVTAISVAVYEKKCDVAAFLLSKLKEKEPVALQRALNVVLEGVLSPTKLISETERLDVLQVFLVEIEKNLPESLQDTLKDAICLAAERGLLDEMRFLLSKAEEMSLEDQEIVLEAALLGASNREKDDMIAFLLSKAKEKGVEVFQRVSNVVLDRFVQVIADTDRLDALRLLLSKIEENSPDILQTIFEEVICLAARRGSLGQIRFLLSTDRSIGLESRRRALRLASVGGHADVVSFLSIERAPL